VGLPTVRTNAVIYQHQNRKSTQESLQCANNLSASRLQGSTTMLFLGRSHALYEMLDRAEREGDIVMSMIEA
jgi:hypothetical protein